MIQFFKTHKIIFLVLVVVLFGIAIWGISMRQTYKPINRERENVEIKEVLIKIGVDINEPFQDLPYDLRVAKGHYLIWVYKTGKLIFDGKEIYTGDNLGHIALSANGLHYAYALKTGVQNYFPVSYDIYVDGENVANAANIKALALADNGEYFYVSGAVIKSSARGEIFRGAGNTIILGVSGDGLTYFAYFTERLETSHKDILIRNGLKLYEGSFLRDFYFSPGGEHYAYTVRDQEKNEETLIVDGQLIIKDSILLLSGITSLGHYAGWNSKKNFIFIDDNKFSIKGDSARVFINESASHHLIYDEGWLLDGEPIQLSVNLHRGLGMVEMMGDIVYVYNVVE